MAIKIVKKALAAVSRAPSPIIPRKDEPSTAPQSPPKAPPAKPIPKSQKPLAKSSEEFSKNPNGLRLPEPTLCDLCGHPYVFPCHGKSDNCMNAKFIRERDAKKP